MPPYIPPFRDLLGHLGYADLARPQSVVFIHDVSVFLKSRDLEDRSFLRDPQPLKVYNEMTTAFLDDFERGLIYWPASVSHMGMRYSGITERRR